MLEHEHIVVVSHAVFAVQQFSVLRLQLHDPLPVRDVSCEVRSLIIVLFQLTELLSPSDLSSLDQGIGRRHLLHLLAPFKPDSLAGPGLATFPFHLPDAQDLNLFFRTLSFGLHGFEISQLHCSAIFSLLELSLLEPQDLTLLLGAGDCLGLCSHLGVVLVAPVEPKI